MKIDRLFKCRVLACMMICIMAIGLMSGCGKSSGGNGASGNGKILFVITDVDDSFRSSLAEAIKTSAQEQGLEIDYQESGDSVDVQKEIIEQAAQNGYSGCICRLADASTAHQMEVAAGDMPIVFVNNDPTSINLVIMKGEKGHSATEGRSKAAIKYFRDNGVDVNLVFSDYANWTDENAYKYMGILSSVGGKYDAVICNNDTMALGVVKYMQDNGISTKDIPVCGVDATADGCASVAAGGMQFIVLQSAEGQGAKAVEAIAAMAKGNSISDIAGATEDGKYIWVDFEKVDASNVANYQ